MTPLKKGAAAESARLRALLRHPLAQRIVAGIHGVDIASYRDERLKKVSPATLIDDRSTPDLVCVVLAIGLCKVATDKTVTELFGQDTVILGLVLNSAGDNGRMYAELFRQGNDIIRKVAGTGC